MHIVTVLGARPQFIKASMVSKAMREQGHLQETLVHTGQHFDANMSDVFFRQLDIPAPDYRLDIHGGSHGDMTGRMLVEIENVLLHEKPDRVLVYGDTNSTLAGALAAAKLHVPVAHVEAGLRSFNMHMPEEINRILTDNLSDRLFCPTQAAVDNLQREGFAHKPVQVHPVGDVMQDVALYFSGRAYHSAALADLPPDGFILATLHRAENTDDLQRLAQIVAALNQVHRHVRPLVLPLHPRTRAVVRKAGLVLEMQVIEPVGYLEMVWLLQHCALVLTDSGGVQKEAFFFRRPCVTLRDQTEWVELVQRGVNTLAGADTAAIVAAVQAMLPTQVSDPDQLYGGGTAAQKIAGVLAQ
jgi:UDP-GlcNAc3NAcA epimerase